MKKYKFVNLGSPLEEMLYISADSRNSQKIFQRDREIHIMEIEGIFENYYIIECFFGDRYFCTFALDWVDLSWFQEDIINEVDYKIIMMDLAKKDAYTDITNILTGEHLIDNFEEYLKEEFHEIQPK